MEGREERLGDLALDSVREQIGKLLMGKAEKKGPASYGRSRSTMSAPSETWTIELRRLVRMPPLLLHRLLSSPLAFPILETGLDRANSFFALLASQTLARRTIDRYHPILPSFNAFIEFHDSVTKLVDSFSNLNHRSVTCLSFCCSYQPKFYREDTSE
ncbi:hypothetical protein SDJN03_18703, partial [Cucurbita argyrosperma subsp. sororia]